MDVSEAAKSELPDAEAQHSAVAPGRSEPAPPQGGAGRRRLTIALLVLVGCAAAAAGVAWWLQARNYESTDDAFIDARPVDIGALVAGQIVDVPVTDNQLVPAGAVLARIDDRDYAAALAQAKGRVAETKAAVANVAAQLVTQQSVIDQNAKLSASAQAALTYSQQENARAQDLVKRGAGTVQAAQQADADLRQKQAALDAAELGELQARKQLAVLGALKLSGEAQVTQAQAQEDLAVANLSRVTLTAPVEGRVTALTAAKGAFAAQGQTLAILVPTQVWVTANFKETQLARIRPGQPAEIAVDAYGRVFKGRVDSVQAGSGTAFSLLPAQNATGNFVKVVQRVPVKIVFDEPPPVVLGPGMSVVPTVRAP